MGKGLDKLEEAGKIIRVQKNTLNALSVGTEALLGNVTDKAKQSGTASTINSVVQNKVKKILLPPTTPPIQADNTIVVKKYVPSN